MSRQHAYTRRLRLLSLLLGAILLLWVPLEDTHERWAILFAAAISLLLVATAAPRIARLPGIARLGHPWLEALLGCLAGLGVTPLGLFLMAFKSGIHGHGRPDFTPEQVLFIIQRWPVFVLSGLLIGLGLGLYRRFTPD